MKSRSVSIAWKIMTIPNSAVLLIGLVFAFVPEAMLSTGFGSFTGQSWSAFVSASQETADLLLLSAGRMFGANILVIAVLLFAVTLLSFREGRRWSWYVLLIASTLGWVSNTLGVLIIGMLPLAIVCIVMLMLGYVALGIGAKNILSKK